MDKFIEIYNKAYKKCKKLREQEFSLDCQVLVDFFYRNEDDVMTYDDEDEDLVLDDSSRALFAVWYINNMLGIDGYYRGGVIKYNIDESKLIN